MDSDISNPIPQSKVYKIQYNVNIQKPKTIASVLLQNIRRDIEKLHETDNNSLSNEFNGLFMTSKCNFTSRKPEMMTVYLDEQNKAHMQTTSLTDVVIDHESCRVAHGKLCVPIKHGNDLNAHVMTNLKCIVAEYNHAYMQHDLHISILMTPVPDCVNNPCAASLQTAKRSFFVAEKYVCKGTQIVHFPSCNKVRFVKNSGLVSPNVLPVQTKCTREQKLAETRQDHKEFMRSLGCTKMFSRESTERKCTGNIISWTTKSEQTDDNVSIVSVYVPVFW